MDVTFANGVTKLIFEPSDNKGKFLLVDTFKDFPKEPTHETTLGDETHKLYLAETCGFNNTLAEFADDKLKRLFFTEEYAKKVRPINLGGAKFARYIPLRENDTRKHQLDVVCGYVEDKLYRVKKISDGFRPTYVVERFKVNTEDAIGSDVLDAADFDIFEAAKLRQEFYSKEPFMFVQVDLINSAAVQDDDGDYTIKLSVEQPTIYEPERGKFYRVVPVQDFGRNGDYQEIYLNGKPCADFFKRLRWSKMFGKVLYEKIDENHDAELFQQLMILRGYKNAKDFYDNDNNHYDSMSDAELLGYEGDYYSDDLWDLNGF